MPYIGLRGMKVGKYVNTNGTISYTDVTEVGDAISANMELTIAEGVLWAAARKSCGKRPAETSRSA